jgi:hypothetical protein
MACVVQLHMKVRMNGLLRDCVEQAYETARLGRNGVHTAREWVSDRMLAELEAAGDAMLGSELRP